MTPARWLWIGKGDSLCLVGFHGHRPVVLGHGLDGLVQRGPDGFLHPFDPNSDDGRIIAAAPDLLRVLREYHRANRLKHDSEAALFDLSDAVLGPLKDIK